jgi:hypothetical protein
MLQSKHIKNSAPVSIQSGMGIIEVVVVIAIVTTAFATIAHAGLFFLRGGLFASEDAQALFLLEEGAEALRFLRDEGYTTNILPLVDAGVLYLEPTSTGWDVTFSDSPIFGQFTRTVELTSVYRRDSDGTIVPSTSADSKTLDTGTVRTTIAIEWNGVWRKELVSYLANIYEN